MLPAMEIASMVQSREISAIQLTEMSLDRIKELDGQVGAFTVVLSERARRSAVQVDERIAAGEYLPLAGLPLAVKDHIWLAGAPATNGSRAYDLKEALRAIIAGNLDEGRGRHDARPVLLEAVTHRAQAVRHGGPDHSQAQDGNTRRDLPRREQCPPPGTQSARATHPHQPGLRLSLRQRGARPHHRDTRTDHVCSPARTCPGFRCQKSTNIYARRPQDPRSVSLNSWTAILSRSIPANVDGGGFKVPTKRGQGQSGTNSAALLLGVQGEEFAKEGTTPCPVLH